MDWETTKAGRVCKACFDGNKIAMRDYGDAYLKGNAAAALPEGNPFRELSSAVAGRKFWEVALKQLDKELFWPAWIRHDEEKKEWERWIKRQKVRCSNRAEKYLLGASISAPSPEQWEEAIRKAIKNNRDGRGHFSRLPLILLGRHFTDPRYPSIEHLSDPGSTDVAVEQRLFNDMKTICSEDEFRLVVGHLAQVLPIKSGKLDDRWRPKRSFGKPEGSDEPPLSKPGLSESDQQRNRDDPHIRK
jgi:hypothetical protein